MQDRQNLFPTAPERIAWNKGKPIGAKPPLRPKHVWSIRTKLQIQGRTRSNDVQSGNRQQIARLRCRRAQGRGHCAAWICGRSSNGPPEEDRHHSESPDRLAGSIRDHRAHPPGGRRLHQHRWQKTGPIPIRQPLWTRRGHHNAAIRQLGRRMGREHWPRSLARLMPDRRLGRLFPTPRSRPLVRFWHILFKPDLLLCEQRLY
jgi:hypothetical protein